MADWSALPDPALALIARRFELIEDFMVFRRTCTSWRAATALNDLFDRSCPKLPLMMLNRPWGTNQNECGDERKFFSLSKRKICSISLAEASGMKHCSASKGWLIMVGSSHDDMSLLNPITRVQIQLPTHPKCCYHFRSAVLSASPSETSEYVLMIVCKASGSNVLCYIAFWKPGDMVWTEIELPEGAYWVDDVNYYNGKFYALASPSQIAVYDVLGPNPKKATKIMDLPWHLSRPHPYLVECAGRLLVIAPYRTPGSSCTPRDDLEMVELDVIKGTYTIITSLANSAVFLGEDDNFSIDATRFPGVIEPNTIYYNHGCYETAICGCNQAIKFKDEPRFHDINGSPAIGLAWINF